MDTGGHRFPAGVGIVIAFVVLGLGAPASASPAPVPVPAVVTFTHGIASGDVTPVSVVLWTRVDRPGLVIVEVSPDPSFLPPVIRRTAIATWATDFTAKVVVLPLQPNQHYYYRWLAWGATSDVGTFRTAPLPGRIAHLRFAYTGDSDGTLVAGRPFFNNFETLGAAAREGLDFFVYLGDTIYSDSSLRTGGPAVSLSEYRDAYKVNRGYANLPALLKSTSTYAIWDDHEVYNDFDADTVDPARYANGLRAFREYMPIANRFPLRDPACRSDPMYRVFPWGKVADVFVLDERSCRSAEARAACTFPGDVLDLAPTLPPSLRIAFGLPPDPPPGCVAAINDPARTMLGSVQKAAFLLALQRSTAKFKFVVNEDPIQQFFALPYDRWEGYAAERVEVLNFLRANGIANVIFLTTDTHAVMMNEVFPDQFTDPAPIAYEAVTGPIATFTFEQEILSFGGPTALSNFQSLLTFLGEDCRNLNVYSYGLVDVDPVRGTATLTMKDGTGGVVNDQQTPSIACTKTFGP